MRDIGERGDGVGCLKIEYAIRAQHARFRRAGVQAARRALGDHATRPKRLTAACGCTNLSVAARSDHKVGRGKPKGRFGNLPRLPNKNRPQAEPLREAAK